MLKRPPEATARGTFVAVLLAMFFVSTGYFMVTPLLALDLTLSLHVTVPVAGLLAGLYVFASQSMQTVGGLLISRFGTLPVLLTACVVALAGFLSLAIASSAAWAAAAVTLAAVGNGGRTVSMKTFVTSVWQGHGVRALTLRSMAINVAAALGPLLGVLLLHHFSLAFVSAGLVNLPLMLLAVRLRRELQRQPSEAPASWPDAFARFRALLRHPLLRYGIAGSIGYWFLYAQLSLTVPLYVHRTYHSGAVLSAMFIVNAVLAALVQATILKRLATQDNIERMLAAGLLVTGFSFLPFAVHLYGAEVFVFIAMFATGEAITVPMLDALAGTAAGWSASAGSAFGLMSVGWAIGGLAGNDLGGLAFSTATQHQWLYLLWFCFSLVGCGSAALIVRVRRHAGSQQAVT